MINVCRNSEEMNESFLKKVCELRNSGLKMAEITSELHTHFNNIKETIKTLAIGLPTKLCLICQELFVPKRNTQQVCYSENCRYKFYRQNFNEYNQKTRKDLRTSVKIKLGSKCIKCGNSDMRVLEINHINGGGCKEYKSKYYSKVFQEILDGKREGEFNLRCANCHILYEHERGIRT